MNKPSYMQSIVNDMSLPAPKVPLGDESPNLSCQVPGGPCTLGIPEYKYAYPLDKDGHVLDSLWDITWTKLHLHERWLDDVFAKKYHRLNKFVADACRGLADCVSSHGDSGKAAGGNAILPYELVPGTVQVTRCFKAGVAYEVVVSQPHSPPQIGVIKIIPFGEHVDALTKFESKISQTLRDLKGTTKFLLHPWLEAIALNQLTKSTLWGHLNVDISEYLESQSKVRDTQATGVTAAAAAAAASDRNKWLAKWKNRYVVIFMSKYHESVWNYFVTIQQTLSTPACTPHIKDIYGQVLWSLFAQLMFRTLPHYKQLGRMCQNDGKIDNFHYQKTESIPDLYVRVHSGSTVVVLKIPTFKRIIYPMDFGFTSVHVPSSRTEYVASFAALLYTNVDAVMSTTNLWTDYYQVMLSMLSFHKYFAPVKNAQFQSLLKTILSVLSQTLKLKPDQLKSAGTLATDADVRTFYIETSKCTINPLPLLLSAMTDRYRHDGPIPQCDPQLHVIHDMYLP